MQNNHFSSLEQQIHDTYDLSTVFVANRRQRVIQSAHFTRARILENGSDDDVILRSNSLLLESTGLSARAAELAGYSNLTYELEDGKIKRFAYSQPYVLRADLGVIMFTDDSTVNLQDVSLVVDETVMRGMEKNRRSVYGIATGAILGGLMGLGIAAGIVDEPEYARNNLMLLLSILGMGAGFAVGMAGAQFAYRGVEDEKPPLILGYERQ